MAHLAQDESGLNLPCFRCVAVDVPPLTSVLAAVKVRFIPDFAFGFLSLLVHLAVQWEVSGEWRWPEVGRLDRVRAFLLLQQLAVISAQALTGTHHPLSFRWKNQSSLSLITL